METMSRPSTIQTFAARGKNYYSSAGQNSINNEVRPIGEIKQETVFEQFRLNTSHIGKRVNPERQKRIQIAKKNFDLLKDI